MAALTASQILLLQTMQNSINILTALIERDVATNHGTTTPLYQQQVKQLQANQVLVATNLATVVGGA